MRNWFMCLAITLVMAAAIALPLLVHRAACSDDEEDIRQKLYLLEQKLAKIESLMAELQTQNFHNASFPKEFPIQELGGILELSSEQQQNISRLLANQVSKGTSQDRIWEVLQLREQILLLLTPQQRKKYLSYLHANGLDF